MAVTAAHVTTICGVSVTTKTSATGVVSRAESPSAPTLGDLPTLEAEAGPFAPVLINRRAPRLVASGRARFARPEPGTDAARQPSAPGITAGGESGTSAERRRSLKVVLHRPRQSPAHSPAVSTISHVTPLPRGQIRPVLNDGSLTRYRRDAATVFDLLGRSENDLTAALGFTLTRSSALLAGLWRRLDLPGAPSGIAVALEVSDEEGRTDLELTSATAKVIVEAKKGWLLPRDVQLHKYAGRFHDEVGLLVTLSDSSTDWAAQVLPLGVRGVPVVHLPWDDVRTDIRAAASRSKGSEKTWLTELTDYLAGATTVRPPDSQWVYCVVVSDDKAGNGGPHTFRDFVTTERVYFHPYGGNNTWPKKPPLFLAFRWGGIVRQVNRVVTYEVVSPDRSSVDGVIGA